MMLTLEAYLMGRDKEYYKELTQGIIDNANRTVRIVNELLCISSQEGIFPSTDKITGTIVASGWRPKSVNDSTRNSAVHSRHLDGLAIDLRDYTDERKFIHWCFLSRNTHLKGLGLWMENPQWTPTWVHLQTVPPRSGLRVYRPSMNPPLVEPFLEQL